jgi:hypothetical protein
MKLADIDCLNQVRAPDLGLIATHDLDGSAQDQSLRLKPGSTRLEDGQLGTLGDPTRRSGCSPDLSRTFRCSSIPSRARTAITEGSRPRRAAIRQVDPANPQATRSVETDRRCVGGDIVGKRGVSPAP